MKIAYIAAIRLPTEKADGYQIMRVCSALAALGHKVSLYVPTWANPITADPAFSLEFKLSLLRHIISFTKLPFFWEHHTFDGQQYWELRKRAYPIRSFLKIAEEVGLVLKHLRRCVDDPARRYFVFSV